MSELSGLLEALELEPAGEGRFRAQNFVGGLGGVVFGGQLLAQTIVAAATIDPGKEVKSLHTIFARGGVLEEPLDIEVDAMHTGRSIASATVTIRQGDRLCNRSLVLLSAPDPDLIRHADVPPAVGAVEGSVPVAGVEGFWELRTVGGIDVGDPSVTGPPDLVAWTRFPDATASGVLGQALLSYTTDGLLIGTAMRPHLGVGLSLAHSTISTTVLSHSLSFHEPVDAGAWYLLVHHSPYAGRGRTYGRGDIFSTDGRLVASFSQDNMVRAFGESNRPAPGSRSKF
jgi:acyl-CoA thioesterase II